MEAIPGDLDRFPSGDRPQAGSPERGPRERILIAMAELVAKRGYPGTTVEHIAARAGIASQTFHEYFDDREECLLACFDLAEAQSRRIIAEAVAEQDDWPAKVRAGISVFLEYIAANPALARTCLVESITAGAAGSARYDRAQRRAAPAFAAGRSIRRDRPRPPDDALERSVISGIAWMIHQRLLGNEADSIPAMLPAVLEYALVPYLGHAGAAALARPL